jgi:hypothetical protein
VARRVSFFPENRTRPGISGQTTPQMLIRFRPDVVDLKARVVVILAGTNDIADNTGPTTIEAIEGNLTSMVELAQGNGIRVRRVSPPTWEYRRRSALPARDSRGPHAADRSGLLLTCPFSLTARLGELVSPTGKAPATLTHVTFGGPQAAVAGGAYRPAGGWFTPSLRRPPCPQERRVGDPRAGSPQDGR